jgi:hypothetical protein
LKFIKTFAKWPPSFEMVHINIQWFCCTLISIYNHGSTASHQSMTVQNCLLTGGHIFTSPTVYWVNLWTLH